MKKSGSTDQSIHRFPELTTAYSHCTFIISSIQAMSSRENPKTKKVTINQGMPTCGHGTPDTFLESCTRYRLKAYKEPSRNQDAKQSNC